MSESEVVERIFGINSVEGRLQSGKEGVSRLLIRDGELSARLKALVDLANSKRLAILKVTDREFEEYTQVNHQGVGLEVSPLRTRTENEFYTLLAKKVSDESESLLFILDGVTDPRNLGACLRSAATLGAMAVIVPKDNSAPLNEAAVKTASGGASIVPMVQVTNLARCIETLQKMGIWTVGTLLETDQALSDVDLCGHIAVVMGSEEKGLRQKTIKSCDFLAKIPMQNESCGFNVSVAAGICLYEVQRQRLVKAS